jgi:ATP phosphoribosyltransferase
VASVNADWNEETRETARLILSRIAAEEEARTMREVTIYLPNNDPDLVTEAKTRFEARLRKPFGEGALTLTCPKDKVPMLADWLIGRGAEHVTVAALDYVFSARNPLYDKLTTRIG